MSSNKDGRVSSFVVLLSIIPFFSPTTPAKTFSTGMSRVILEVILFISVKDIFGDFYRYLLLGRKVSSYFIFAKLFLFIMTCIEFY